MEAPKEKRIKETYYKYKCLKSFPGFRKGRLYEEDVFEFDFVIDPCDYPEYFKPIKKERWITINAVREDLSSLLGGARPICLYDRLNDRR